MLLEICAGSLHSALAAEAGGAYRIELCDNLGEGGTTPSPGTIIQAIHRLSIPVFILIRPRPGDFLYSEEEYESMKDDISFCKEYGAKGVALGILKNDGSVDVERTVELVQIARPMQVTFHRAFDLARDPFQALEDVISLGIDRILTSGQAPTAVQGSGLIRELVIQSAGRITIMPGSGVSESNVSDLITLTGAKEVHASLRGPVESRMQFRNETLNMGKTGHDKFSHQETDAKRVHEMMRLLDSISR
jgi:copper homeostasis protein